MDELEANEPPLNPGFHARLREHNEKMLAYHRAQAAT